jgi:HK97 family phage major capsid protein
VSTHQYPLSDRAREVVSTLKNTFVTNEQFDGLKGFVSEELEKSNRRTREMLDSHRAPGMVSKRWKVRIPGTREVREFEYSLGKILWTLQSRKANGFFPTERSYEHEVDYVKRTITEGSSSAGGTLIPQEWTDFVIPELGAKVVFLKAGPNVLPMQHQILNIPGLTSNATYSWQGENASISESAPATNNTPLTLHTLKGLTGVSIEWLRDATPETDAALQANLVRGASRAVDNGYFNGSGSSNQPTGLFNVSSIATAGAGNGATNGSTPLLDDISNGVYELDSANAPEEGRTWFCNPRTVHRLRLLRDTLGRPILWENPANRLDMMLAGYPVYTTTQIPINQTVGSASTASSMLLVAMSDIYVGQGIKSQGLEVAISDQALFTSAEIAIRLLYRTDIQPGHAASIFSLTGIL